MLDLFEDGTEPGDLGGAQVALPLLFLVRLDVPAGVRGVRAPAPDFGEIERLGEQGEDTVGGIGSLPHPRVEAVDVLARDVDDLPLTQLGEDVLLPHALVVPNAAGLLLRSVVSQEASGEIGHGRRLEERLAVLARVQALGGLRQHLARPPSRLVEREHPIAAEHHDPLPAHHPVRDHEGLLAARVDPQPEARQGVVPPIVGAAFVGRSVDHALGEPHRQPLSGVTTE